MNYARMEEVWRSYGPLEAIGPEETDRKARRRKAAVVAGVVTVCALGAGAGLYLQPDLEERTPSKSEARRGPVAEARPKAARSGTTALSEAQALEAQLEMAVADAPPGGDPLQPAFGMTPGGQGGPFVPLGTEPRLAPPAPGPSLRPRVTVGTYPPPGPAPASRSRPVGPVRGGEEGQERPMVIASASPTPRTYPRSAPLPASRPAAPSPAPAAPVATNVPDPAAVDCSRAGNAADRMVCESPALAALDRRMETELAAAAAAGHPRALLLKDQADWRSRRNAAAPDPRAVADAYRRRIGQLQSMH